MKYLFTVALLIGFNITHAATKHQGSLDWFQDQFEILLKSDAGDAEDLDIEIGRMIKTHPTNFIKTLQKYETKIQRIDSLVGNFGTEFVDQTEKSKAEAEQRIQSLRKAISRSQDKNFIRLGQLCIENLQKF